MHVSLLCAGLAGMGPRAVADRCGAAWRNARPADVVQSVPTSHGEVLEQVGTGLDDVVQARFPDATASIVNDDGRRVVWQTGHSWFIDLAETHTWDGAGDPRGSTAFVGRDILRALEAGVTSLYLHVPQFFTRSDLGIGMLHVLAGEQTAEAAADLPELVARARRRTSSLRVVLTYPYDLTLIGMDGMARAWASRGFNAEVAQEQERTSGALAHELSKNAGTSLLSRGPSVDPRSVYAGVGGGLGLMASALGWQVARLGEALNVVVDAEADLVVYVCDVVGMEVPAGLNLAAEQAEQHAIPIVLLSRDNTLRRGELPRLGLHGAYGLNRGSELADLAAIPAALDDAIGRIARTWGWD